MEIIGKALAGHAFRISGHKKAEKYDNPMTDFINLIIAESKAKAIIKEQKSNAPGRKQNRCMDDDTLDEVSNFETDRMAGLTHSSMQKRFL